MSFGHPDPFVCPGYEPGDIQPSRLTKVKAVNLYGQSLRAFLFCGQRLSLPSSSASQSSEVHIRQQSSNLWRQENFSEGVFLISAFTVQRKRMAQRSYQGSVVHVHLETRRSFWC